MSQRLQLCAAFLVGLCWCAEVHSQVAGTGLRVGTGNPITVGNGTFRPAVGMITSVNPYAIGANATMLTGAPPAAAAYPYPPYTFDPFLNGANNPYRGYQDPLSGFLHGAASVVRSQGLYQIDRQQSRVLQQQVISAEIDNRRRIFDEYQYEIANTPSLQDLREKTIKLERRRAASEPPITEVLSGSSLNTLLNHVYETMDKSKEKLPNVPISEEVIKHINVTSGSGYSLGAVKHVKEGTNLSWPISLKASTFDADRKKLDDLLPTTLDGVVNRNLTPDVGGLNEMRAALDGMTNRLSASIGDLTPDDYISSKRYLNQLDSSLKALREGNAQKHLNKLNKVKSVADLVQEMRSSGLRFAPAANGDESAYAAVHQAFVSVVNTTSSLEALAPPPPPK